MPRSKSKKKSGGMMSRGVPQRDLTADEEIYDAGELPTMTVKVRRVNKSPNTPGSRQAGRGRTYTRTIIG
jgi:hypothetical protein